VQYALEDFLRLVRKRTGRNNDDNYLVDELNAAADWTYNKLMTMNEDILKEEDETFTLASLTSSYNLGASVARPNMYAIKWLGVQLVSNAKFSPVQFMDSANDAFMSADQDQPATAFPVFCDTKNFNQVRFAPPLPAGTKIMVSYVWIGLLFDLNTNAALTSTTYPGIPNPINQSIADRATAQVFLSQDDTRWQQYDNWSRDRLRAALNVIDKRQWQQIPRVKGFARRAARRFF
jgi:hypothetical protein